MKKIEINEEKLRNLYLKDLALGKIQGPLIGKASVEKPWLQYYSDEQMNFETPKMTVYEYLYENNKDHLNDIAMEYFGNKISYKKLFCMIDAAASNFIKLNVKKNEIVSVCMPSTPEAIATFYALNKIGAIPNMLDPRTNEEGLRDLVNEGKSKKLVTIDLCCPKFSKVIKETEITDCINISVTDSLPLGLKMLSKAKGILSKEVDKKIDGINNIKWNDFIHGNYIQPSWNNNQYDEIEKDLAVILHSGGTTGKPKSIMLSNLNLNSVLEQYKHSKIEFSRGQSLLSIIPPFSSYGLCVSMHMPLSFGVTAVLIPKFNVDEFDKLLLKYKPNHVLGVPSFYDNLTRSKKIKNADLSFLTNPAVGGDSILPTVEDRINSFLAAHNEETKLVKGYGMSELSSSACTCMGEVTKLTSVGIPLPKTEISIYDPETDEELSYNEIGEINVTGPGVFLGYYNDKELTDRTIVERNGKKYIRTGDFGHMTEDGMLYHDGRIKRMIVRFDGYKIYPANIENTILSNEFVKECSVIGGQVLELGTMPIACISLKNDVDKNYAIEAIKDVCKQNLTERDQPYSIEIYDELPKTVIGKLDTTKMTEQFNNKQESDKVMIKK